jgi:hypothetical protein
VTTKALDPMAYTDSGPEEIPWATDAQHVTARQVIARRAKNPADLAELDEMLGFGTEQMRVRYARGLAELGTGVAT